MNFRLFALLTALVPCAAQADWQYTTWNMGPEEVVSASNGMVKLGSGKPSQAVKDMTVGAVGTYQLFGWSLPVTFYFKANRLVAVDIAIEGDAQCYVINERLSGEYGRPIAAEENPMILRKRWHDTKRGNHVEFMRAGATCWLNYKSPSSARNSGL